MFIPLMRLFTDTEALYDLSVHLTEDALRITPETYLDE